LKLTSYTYLGKIKNWGVAIPEVVAMEMATVVTEPTKPIAETAEGTAPGLRLY
jgi:hypothetical protein